MHLPDFDFYAPESVAEACELMTRYQDEARVINGGTDILPRMKNQVMAPAILVSIKRLPGMKRIEYIPGKGIVIGAGVTLNEIALSEVIESKYHSICHAAAHMAANQIRNIGTLGGNIVASIPSADMPPILIALGATAKIAGPTGERVMPLEDVFTGPGKTVLAKNEILTEVFVPDGKMTGSAYHKFALRRAGALAVVGVAVAVEIEKGVIKDARVVLGAVAPVPLRAVKVDAFLKGKPATDEVFAEAGEIAYDECRPITDFRASAEYRRELVKVYTKRCLKKVVTDGHKAVVGG
ncbi:MAG: xanthine dehydrogenase family protein subunit M [Peptococcaceae bacterium]|jgi:carbon-monoxide dehydrogenase medium subunit|nr:xanthine dehydrogenase family protein subunit M [Peptococcaceae bacterium]